MPPRIWIPGASTASTTNKHLTSRTRRREALSLYREILRTAKHFHWADEKTGEPWNKLLKQQARKEFDEAKQETDPLIIARLLVTGRDCVQQVQNRFNEATQVAWKRIEEDSKRR
uniref:Complex 1 LYR protein domain-containing protein n=1 Tax=Entomoneis paludosa TaxID=265537 RepID=A0A7S2YSI5_9STRA|mmetsp:Transcript_7795/g.16272  ORF Transcript_7795/g.16272 Transcript_7795/m.16272 type:complete len:115 (+) Transcript_7795:166-510(+)